MCSCPDSRNLEGGVLLATCAFMRPLRGFSLLEFMTAVGIVGILAGLSAIALTRLRARGNFASASGDFVSGLRVARAESFSRGDNTVVIVDVVNGRWWSVEDVNGDFDLTTFDPNAPAPSPDRLINRGFLPVGVSFGPPAGWGTALPLPLSGIPTGFLNLPDGGTANITTDGGSGAPNLPYCSFCNTSSKLGAIIFHPGGGATFSAGSATVPQTIGNQVAMQDVALDGGTAEPSGIIDFAIVQTTGSIE